MIRTSLSRSLIGAICIAWAAESPGQEPNKPAVKKPTAKKLAEPTPVWTDANDPELPIDYKFQGEYGSEPLGAQVIALGNGQFQAVVLEGGLPGAGWNGADKSLMQGSVQDDRVQFEPAIGARTYLAQAPEQFSATKEFPPHGQRKLTGSIDANGYMTINTATGEKWTMARVTRASPTLGAKPPQGAIVLFDGSNTDEWIGGRLDTKTGWLNTDGKDIKSQRKFNNYTIHLEFMLPFRPDARGQARGNSGFYQVHHYEVQVLDSFGLEGLNNECGGIYTKAAPKVNMCFPPLTWQTYDIDFTNAVVEDGQKVKNARITARHNGIVIHDNLEIDGPTGGSRKEPEGTPGPLLLQGHGNPLQYRNVWIVERN
ncbi:MAG TPA: DUF1080 domain-containing protein [Pirellulales bacterium]|nr:DUF1080 domain-containing protein [Pirellulales bacterium]